MRKKSPAPGTLPETIAQRLAADLERYRPDGKLPPLRSLVDAYGVSRQTLSLAVRRLAEQGLVTLRPNQPPRIGPAPRIEPVAPAATRLLRFLRARLESGEWRSPKPLPKIAAMAGEWHL